jgi:hypothetical protein
MEKLLSFLWSGWKRIYNTVLSSSTDLVSQQFYNNTKTETVTNGTTSSEKAWKMPEFDLLIQQIKCSAYVQTHSFMPYDDTAGTKRDKIKVILRDSSGNNLVGGDGLDLLELDRIGQNQNFQPFVVPKGEILSYQFAHTQVNADHPIECSITLVGRKIDLSKMQTI